MPRIFMVLVDDWELRGNGSGDIEKIQFQTMRHLVDIYNDHGIRSSFFAEVMQQMTFRRIQDRHEELKRYADRWENLVTEVYREGHDFQLHLHPQWTQADYAEGTWHLQGDWSILNYDADAAYRMITEGQGYLENLLQSIDANYRCIAFRAGSWCVAPSPHLLSLLVKAGIAMDASMVGGLHTESRAYQLDYRNCEESFFPYYPRMQDARKVSPSREAIVCVPNHHFIQPPLHMLQSLAAGYWRKFRSRSQSNNAPQPAGVAAWEAHGESADCDYSSGLGNASSTFAKVKKLLLSSLRGFHRISDISELDTSSLRYMMRCIRKRVRASGLSEVPVIIENHTKNIKDFSHIRKFVSEISRDDDLKFITLTELAENLNSGRFKIKLA